MEKIVYTEIERPDPGNFDALRTHGVATLHEAMTEARLLAPGWQCLNVGDPVVGPVMTAINDHADNLAVHRVVSLARAGDVIFIGHRRPFAGAVLGDLVAYGAKLRGVAGFVVDGAIRDIAAVEALGIPVWYRTVDPNSVGKDTLSGVNVPVLAAGAWIIPGDVMVADRDGVVVLRPAEVSGVLEAARLREQKEAATRRRLAAGESTYEVLGLAEQAERAGIREVAGPYPRGSFS